MEEYKGNSNKAKEQQKALPPEKKVEKIVSGPVKSKKKNSIQKITSIFVPEDVEDVKSYIFEDIVVPAVKDIILDAVRALLGVSGKSNKGAPASKVSYRSYYKRNGEGGLFTINRRGLDMRSVEIWYQMCWHLQENFRRAR